MLVHLFPLWCFGVPRIRRGDSSTDDAARMIAARAIETLEANRLSSPLPKGRPQSNSSRKAKRTPGPKNLEKYPGASRLVKKRAGDTTSRLLELRNISWAGLYEAEFVLNEHKGYSVTFSQLPEAITFGCDLLEAFDRAAEVLELIIAEYLDEGRPLPPPVFTGYSEDVLRSTISVVVTAEIIERSKCVSASDDYTTAPGPVFRE